MCLLFNSHSDLTHLFYWKEMDCGTRNLLRAGEISALSGGGFWNRKVLTLTSDWRSTSWYMCPHAVTKGARSSHHFLVNVRNFPFWYDGLSFLPHDWRGSRDPALVHTEFTTVGWISVFLKPCGSWRHFYKTGSKFGRSQILLCCQSGLMELLVMFFSGFCSFSLCICYSLHFP